MTNELLDHIGGSLSADLLYRAYLAARRKEYERALQVRETAQVPVREEALGRQEVRSALSEEA